MPGYLQHARRHLPGGSDPVIIPSPYAYYAGTFGNIANGATAYSDITGPAAANEPYTNSPAIFTVGTQVVGGSSYHGPVISQSGLYKVTAAANANGAGGGFISGTVVFAMSSNDFGVSVASAIQQAGGPQNYLSNGAVSWIHVWGADAVPSPAQVWKLVNNTGSTLNAVNLSVLIEQLDTFVPAGGSYPVTF